MDIDNIDDIELLRQIARHGKVKLKQSVANQSGYVFNIGNYYPAIQYPDHIELFSYDYNNKLSLKYRPARKYIYGSEEFKWGF